jgi:hypothetical protein
VSTKITGTENTTGDLVAPNGKVWRKTRHSRNGEPLFVIDGVDPESCPQLVMSTEPELEAIFGEPLAALGGAA